ncbi:MAG: protein translocase subunit SecF [Halanaerobiales bacterium]
MSKNNLKSKKSKSKNKHSKNINRGKFNEFKNFYEKNLSKLFVISISLFVVGLLFLGFNYANTGQLVNRGIDLTGGSSIVFESDYDVKEIENDFSENFDLENIFRDIDGTNSIILEVSTTDSEVIDSIIEFLRSGYTISDEVSIESTNPTLGEGFFRQISLALLIAFVFMAGVVSFYFKEFVPSIAIIYSAFADITLTIVILNLLGVRMSSAGIAALLMLIGYSVDTDILLATNVLRNESKIFFKNVYTAMRTGFFMTITTLVAVTVGFFLATSVVLEQIMLVLMIGLIIDLMNTWFVNTSLLRYYLEKKNA